MIIKKISFITLALVAFTMLTSPLLAEAVPLNYYSDYGVVEQNQTKPDNPSALSLQNDPFGYSGAYTDHESGLQCLQVRYYCPLITRFTQMDTYLLMNRYAYANENPVMNDDPSGHSAVGAGSSGSAQGFVGSFDQAAVNFGTYFFTFEVGTSIITNIFPGLGTLASIFSTVMINTVASAAGTAAVSGYTHTKITAQMMGSALVNGFVGQVFDSGGEYGIRELMLSRGAAFSTARAVADTLGQGLYALGDVTTNPMFKVKTNYRELGVYYAISAAGYALLNGTAALSYGRTFDAANNEYNTALSTKDQALNDYNQALNDYNQALSEKAEADAKFTDLAADDESYNRAKEECEAAGRFLATKQEALTAASTAFDSAQSYRLRVQEVQRRLIFTFKGLLIKPGASALTYGNR